MDKVETLQQIAKLISLHLMGDITPDEQVLLDEWINGSERNAQVFSRITDAATLAEALQELQNADTEDGLSNVKLRIAQEKDSYKKAPIRLWPRIAAAASILVMLSAGSYFLLHKKQPPQQIVQYKPQPIAPGRNQATLTLANGKQIVISKNLNGQVATQGNAVVQASAGAIAYNQTSNDAAIIQYNTLSTARGEQSPSSLVLADGTRVWLNAASSITYPTSFTEKQRVVKITGEAYFEVAHNSKQPFEVEVNGQTIQDIGTAFDINAYNDEPVLRTTLLAGSVRVSKAGQSVVLIPGQQALSQIAGENIRVTSADAEEAVAWKNGYFKFDNENIQSIMRKVSRWYDVDIQYQGTIPTEEFGGKMSRYKDVSEVLDMLELTRLVHFKVEGRRIIVMQ